MLLFALLLLTSALASQRHGAQAESNLSVKLQFSSAKEQNGVQDPQHEKIITVSTNGSIHSPKFPHAYPRNTVLVWRLVAVEENVWIQLTFDERFGLEDPEDDICNCKFFKSPYSIPKAISDKAAEKKTRVEMFLEIMEVTLNERAHLHEWKDVVSNYRKDASEREDTRDARDERW